jgi:hypothetical protein
MANNELAAGFIGMEDVFTERVTTVGVKVVWDAIQESLDVHNTELNAMLSAWVQRTTLYSERFMLPGDGTLQPLDDKGNPKPVQVEGHYDVAYPLQGGGTAWGNNRVSRALMTVEEVNRHVLNKTEQDIDWMARHMLAALFPAAAYTYVDEEWGSLSIQPLALASDGIKYLMRNGKRATDTHLLAQAAAIADGTNPYPGIYAELYEHPSNRVSATNPVVVYIASDQVATTIALTHFHAKEQAFIVPGGSTDTVSTNAQNFVAFGDYLGVTDNCIIAELGRLPDGYLVAHATGAGAGIAQREYDDPSLQGFFSEEHSPDGNLMEHRMIRYAGFGVRNRVAFVVQRIGNAAYAAPTGFDPPLNN